MLKGRKINLLGNRPRSSQDNVDQAIKHFLGEVSLFLSKDAPFPLITSFFEKTKQTTDVIAELKNFESISVLNEFAQFLVSVKNELNPENPFDEKFKALMTQAKETANYLRSGFSSLDDNSGLQLIKNYTNGFEPLSAEIDILEEKVEKENTNRSIRKDEINKSIEKFDLKLPKNFLADLFERSFRNDEFEKPKKAENLPSLEIQTEIIPLESNKKEEESETPFMIGEKTEFSLGFNLNDLFKKSTNGYYKQTPTVQLTDESFIEDKTELIEPTESIINEESIPEISDLNETKEELILEEETVVPDLVDDILEYNSPEENIISEPEMLVEETDSLEEIHEPTISSNQSEHTEVNSDIVEQDNFHWMMDKIVENWSINYSDNKYFQILKEAIGGLIQSPDPISAFRSVSQNPEYIEFCDFLDAISNNPDFNRDFVVAELDNISSKTYNIFTLVIREQTESIAPQDLMQSSDSTENGHESSTDIEEEVIDDLDLIIEEPSVDEPVSDVQETISEDMLDDFSTPEELGVIEDHSTPTNDKQTESPIDNSDMDLGLEDESEIDKPHETQSQTIDYYSIVVKIYQDIKQLNISDENSSGINQFIDFSLSLKDPIETLREHLEIQDVKDFIEFVDVLHNKYDNKDLTAYQPLIDHERAIAEQIYGILKSYVEIYGDSKPEEYSDDLRLVKHEDDLHISDTDTENVFDEIEQPLEDDLIEDSLKGDISLVEKANEELLSDNININEELIDEPLLDDSSLNDNTLIEEPIIEESSSNDLVELNDLSEIEEPLLDDQNTELNELEEISQTPVKSTVPELDELSEILEEPVRPSKKEIEEPKPVSVAPVQESISRPTQHKVLDEIQKIFLVEADEYIQKLSNDLLQLEKELDNSSLIDSILRSAHTLKGSAGMMKFHNMNKLGHKMEDVFQFLRDEKVAAERELVDIMLKSTDLQQAMLNSLQQNGNDFAEGVDQAIFQLQEYLKKLEAKKEGSDYKEEKFVPVKSETAPATADHSVAEGGENKMQQQGNRPVVAEQNLRINISTLNSLINLAAELLISRNRMTNQLGSMEGILNKLSKEKVMLQTIMKKFQGLAGKNDSEADFLSSEEQGILKDFADTEFDRFSDYDVIIRDLKGNISNYEDVSREIRELGDAFRQSILSVSSIANELNREIMGMRMVPVKHMFIRFQRSIRDIGREENKQVDLKVEGEETRLDKTVMEDVIEPIMHCVRNAVSHGIEMPDTRTSRGKNAEGLIILRAFQDGNQVVLEIEDDGNGIDPAKLKQSAINKKLISPERALSMTDSEAMELMFVPGFSTAEKVTTLSGRGVGMDVVKNVVTRFKGSVSVKSNIGKGSKFIIRLPLTLAINQSLLIQVAGRIYAFPLSVIDETLELKMDSIRRIGDQELISVRDQTVPLIHLSRVLSVDEDPSQMKSKYPVVILSDAGQKIGIRVDRLLGKEEIVIKTLGSHLKNVAGVVGATVLGDGSVVLIMDVGYLFQYWQGGGSVAPVIRSEIMSGFDQHEEVDSSIPKLEQSGAERRFETLKIAVKGKIRILCADDSVSIRKYVASLLSRERFDVTTAADGAEAYEYAERNTYDIIMTDLEMPKMHGYELISALRAKAAFNHIPIVILTARSGEKHRRRGLELGANAFLNKPFDVDELLNTIDGLLGK